MMWDKEFRQIVDNKRYLTIILIVSIFFGLICKLLLALNINLNSDTVVPGLQAMEIFSYGNTFLDGFNYPVNYPAVFTDLLPFHLLIQLLTNYDPAALRLTAFLIFILILAIYSALVYKVTGDRVKALLFMAFLANLTPSAYYFFVQPVSHGATVMFAGLLIYFLLDFEKLRSYQKALVAIAVFLITFSDNMALAIIVMPFMVVYTYTAIRSGRKKLASIGLSLICVLIPAFAAYACKWFIPGMIDLGFTMVGAYDPPKNLPRLFLENVSLYVTNLLTVVNDQLLSLLQGTIGPYELAGLALAGLFGYSLWTVSKDAKKYPPGFLLLLLVSNALLFLVNVLTSISAARYLLFASLSVFIVLALGYDKSKIYLALAAIVVISAAAGSIMAIQTMGAPNQAENSLIGYLKENKLDVGFSGYWDSNIVTYLSKGDIKVRAVGYNNGHIVPYDLLSCSKWYEDRPTKFFLLYHVDHDYGDIGAISSSLKWKEMRKYGNYYIFIYDLPESPLVSH
jgi:hypothetical protein